MTDVKKGFGKVVGNGEVKEDKLTVAEYKVVIAEMEEALCMLENKIGKSERVSVMAGLTITNKNISSQLSYLRDDLAKEGAFDLVRIGRGHGKLKLIKLG